MDLNDRRWCRPLALLALALASCGAPAPPGAACARTSECGAGLECRFGRCRTGCVANRDCPIGASCLRLGDAAGVCGVAPDLGCETGVGRDCPDGLVCVDDQCERACTDASECPSDGACVPREPGAALLFCFDTRGGRPDAGAVDAAQLDAGVPRRATDGPYLVPSDVASAESFGASVALSADGMFAIVGAPNDTAGGSAGSARVFTRSGSTWGQQARLVPAGALGVGVGRAVALDAGATRAIVTSADSAYAFVRTGAVWTEEGELRRSGTAPSPNFGCAVALSDDGATAIVGMDADEPAGSARVFARTGTVWTEEAVLVPSEIAPGVGAIYGGAVAISADGSRALVGARSGSLEAVGARVFVRTGMTWSEEARLTWPASAARANTGGAVALSGDGARALVAPGPPGVPGDAAAGLFFTRTGTTWSEPSVVSTGYASTGVALCGDGSVGLAGIWNAVLVLAAGGSGWTVATSLAPRDEPGRGFGWHVALSADCRTALVGSWSGDVIAPPGTARIYELPRLP